MPRPPGMSWSMAIPMFFSIQMNFNISLGLCIGFTTTPSFSFACLLSFSSSKTDASWFGGYEEADILTGLSAFSWNGKQEDDGVAVETEKIGF